VCRYGEKFSRDKHEPGTEIKAITYSNMQILSPHESKAGLGAEAVDGASSSSRWDIYVIVDI